jgi:uncharacterized protein YcfJ
VLGVALAAVGFATGGVIGIAGAFGGIAGTVPLGLTGGVLGGLLGDKLGQALVERTSDEVGRRVEEIVDAHVLPRGARELFLPPRTGSD